MKKYNLLLILPLVLFRISNLYAETLPKSDLPKVIVSKSTAAFTRKYRGKNVSIKGSIKFIGAIDEGNKFVWFYANSTPVPVACPVPLEKSAMYDGIRERDIVTIAGQISYISNWYTDQGTLTLQKGCIITKILDSSN
jgi:hypothetical protein